jgi:hypothetical protein
VFAGAGKESGYQGGLAGWEDECGHRSLFGC